MLLTAKVPNKPPPSQTIIHVAVVCLVLISNRICMHHAILLHFHAAIPHHADISCHTSSLSIVPFLCRTTSSRELIVTASLSIHVLLLVTHINAKP